MKIGLCLVVAALLFAGCAAPAPRPPHKVYVSGVTELPNGEVEFEFEVDIRDPNGYYQYRPAPYPGYSYDYGYVPRYRTWWVPGPFYYQSDVHIERQFQGNTRRNYGIDDRNNGRIDRRDTRPPPRPVQPVPSPGQRSPRPHR